MGFEKLEPMRARQEVEQLFSRLRRVTINNTALRFRFQSQVQKYGTLGQYWTRICRQIEEGTYKRDVRRASERAAVQAPKPTRRSTMPPAEPAFDRPSASSVGLLGELDDPFADNAPELRSDDLDDELQAFFGRHSAPPPHKDQHSPASPKPLSQLEKEKLAREQTRAKAAQAEKQRRAARARGLSEERMKKIYAAYLTARKRCHEPVDTVPFERVARSLLKQYEKSGGNVDFKVVVRGGKAAIKAVKKKH